MQCNQLRFQLHIAKPLRRFSCSERGQIDVLPAGNTRRARATNTTPSMGPEAEASRRTATAVAATAVAATAVAATAVAATVGPAGPRAQRALSVLSKVADAG